MLRSDTRNIGPEFTYPALFKSKFGNMVVLMSSEGTGTVVVPDMETNEVLGGLPAAAEGSYVCIGYHSTRWNMKSFSGPIRNLIVELRSA